MFERRLKYTVGDVKLLRLLFYSSLFTVTLCAIELHYTCVTRATTSTSNHATRVFYTGSVASRQPVPCPSLSETLSFSTPLAICVTTLAGLCPTGTTNFVCTTSPSPTARLASLRSSQLKIGSHKICCRTGTAMECAETMFSFLLAHLCLSDTATMS